MKTNSKSVTAVLEKATGITRKEGQSDQKYLATLARKANDLEEGDWKKLPKEAQTWANDAAKQINEKEAITLPTGFSAEADDSEEDADAPEDTEDESEEEADGEDEEETEEEPAPKKKSKKAAKPVKVAKKAKAEAAEEDEDEDEDAEEEAPAKKSKAPKTKVKSTGKRGGMHYYRTLIIQHEGWPMEKLIERVRAKGFALSDTTASIQFYETRGVLKILRELGRLRPVKKAE